MPNIYFRAKSLWEHGQREGGFSLLHDHLKAALGREVFLRPDSFIDGSDSAFESLVYHLLFGTVSMSAQTILQAPFCRVLVELWRLNPWSDPLLWLREYDFFVPPSSGIMDMEEYAPPPNDETDFAALCDALAASAESGLLSGKHVGVQSGRAILALEDIDAVPDRAWGALKPMLRERLRNAYASAPLDFWSSLVERDTLGVLERFLQHLFGRNGSPNAAALVIWKIVVAHFPDYAKAAKSALSRVLAGNKPELLTELVQIDAGRLAVSDGAAWLRALEAGLTSLDFNALT